MLRPALAGASHTCARIFLIHTVLEMVVNTTAQSTVHLCHLLLGCLTWTWFVTKANTLPSVTFETPVLVGKSNSSLPGGSAFWYASISISTGIKGHVAQHVTLSKGRGGCQYEGLPNQACEQIMLTSDGGMTYNVVKKIRNGTSGNFNGYNDLGTWVPPKKGSKPTPGKLNERMNGWMNECMNERTNERTNE